MMQRELLHICGPFSIYSYGLSIVIGLLTFMWFAQRDVLRKKYMTHDQFTQAIFVGVILGFLGGRILYMINNYSQMGSTYEIVAFWEYGGFSILGTVLGIIIFMPIYLKFYNIPILPFLDLASLYAPLMQAISRIGCFMAGCCYGIPTKQPWGILYTDEQSVAPLHERIHPTQIYSSLLLLSIFALMYFVLRRILKKPGQLMAAYLFFSSASRFTVDFWRADHEYIAGIDFLSFHQLLALAIMMGSGSIFIFLSVFTKKQYE